jgi:hypothetical protein
VKESNRTTALEMADVDAKALVTVLGGQITREAAVALLRQELVEFVHL